MSTDKSEDDESNEAYSVEKSANFDELLRSLRVMENFLFEKCPKSLKDLDKIKFDVAVGSKFVRE